MHAVPARRSSGRGLARVENAAGGVQVPSLRVQLPQTCSARRIRAVDCDVTDDDAVASVTLESPVHFSCFDDAEYPEYAESDVALARQGYWRLEKSCFLCACEASSQWHACNAWVRVHCADDDGGEHEALAFAELRMVRSGSPPSFVPRLYLKVAGKCAVLSWALHMLEILRAAHAAGAITDPGIAPLPLLSDADARGGMNVTVFAMKTVGLHYARLGAPEVLREVNFHASRMALEHGPVACFLPQPERAKEMIAFWRRLLAARVVESGMRVPDDAGGRALAKFLSTGMDSAQRAALAEKLQQTPPEMGAPHLVPFYRSMRTALDEQRRLWATLREHHTLSALHAYSSAGDFVFLRDTLGTLGRHVLYSTEVVAASP